MLVKVKNVADETGSHGGQRSLGRMSWYEALNVTYTWTQTATQESSMIKTQVDKILYETAMLDTTGRPTNAHLASDDEDINAMLSSEGAEAKLPDISSGEAMSILDQFEMTLGAPVPVPPAEPPKVIVVSSDTP